MAPQRRRSSRLRGTPGKLHTPSRLESLAERDETPNDGAQSNLDALVTSPLPPQTPVTAGKIVPARKEMHPSLAHQSTAPKPDSGLRLGFSDIKPAGTGQQTPSKTGITDSAFDFRFARPGPQLGPDAQRMMDELREEALKIKAKLAAEREEEKRKEEQSGVGIASRKFAQPKGKVGRFSDVHMAEFRKMDSIAGHPSSFRAQPGRFTPNTGGLKRSQSKAQLDDREEASAYKKTVPVAETSGRLENDAPAKRARKHVNEDTSSARPVSRGDNGTPSTPRSQANLAHITTPTHASLARAAGAKATTQIPTLTRSPSKPNLVGTQGGLTRSKSKPNLMDTQGGLTRSATTGTNLNNIPRSASKPALRSPGKFERVKSILRHVSGSRSNRGPSTIPTLTRTPSKSNLDKALPSTPGSIVPVKNVKHVNFTPDTVNKHAAAMAQNSPTPMKSGIPRSTSKINFGTRTIFAHPSPAKAQGNGAEYPSLAGISSLRTKPMDVEYPTLAGVRPLPELPRRLPEPPRRVAASKPPLPVPGTFTFRSDHTISFGPSPKGFGSSPGQASVRQVRESILPNSMPGSFSLGNKENVAPTTAISHGMANKKRRRADSDDEIDEEADRSPKKQKAATAEGHMLVAPKMQTEDVSPRKIATPAKKRAGLSLSRLNMLARPKNRK